MKYYNKFLVLFLINVICVLLIQFARTDNGGSFTVKTASDVKNEEIQNAIETSDIVETNRKALIIYDPDSNALTYQANQLKDRLSNMKIKSQVMIDNEVSGGVYKEYDSVIVMSDDWSGALSQQLYELIKYAENGGKVLFGVVPKSIDGPFKGIYRSLGIVNYSSYVDIDGYKYEKELMVGSKGISFIDEENYNNICLNVKVDTKDCQIYMSSDGKTKDIPLLWSKKFNSGNLVVFNTTGLGDRYSAGIFAGAMAILQDDFMYPIINAKTIFIDDFPSPQYNVKSQTITQNYNRSVIEFYRDIWWPDMQKAASQYNYNYTGLFITSYNNNVNEYKIEEDPNFKYYGNSLLKNGFEIGLHGYNHQPLALDGFIPKEMGYVPWKSQEDMIAAINTLNNCATDLFNTKLTVYVPPSNFLSPEGRKAIAKSDTDISVISGVYVAQNNEYEQDFNIAEDGIVEFPRLTSGMWNEPETQVEYMCGISMYGVFSHFLHPDDILDEERGKNADWESLYKGYTEILKEVNSVSPLRSLNASESAQAMKVYSNLEVKLEYREDYIKGACNNFTGEAYFYIRTGKTPIAANDSCVIEKADKENGEFFYVVTVKKPEFEIKLEGK